MEGVALDHSNKLKPSTIPMAQFHYSLSDESDQDSSTTATHLCIVIQFILANKTIYPYFTTIWDHTNGCANRYRCETAIYLLSCLALEFSIILDRAAAAPEHGKYVVDGLNAR